MRSLLDRYLPVFQAPDAPGGGSTSTPSPSSAPSSIPSGTTPDPGSSQTSTPSDGADSSFEFMFANEGGDSNPFEGLSSLGETKPEPTIPQPIPAAAPQPVSGTPAPVPPAQTTTPVQTEVTSQVPSGAPSLDSFDPGQLAQHLVQNQEQVVQYVADNLFKLSDKDVEALESDVVGTIPKLLARSFVAAQQNLLMQMARIIPSMIQRQGDVTKAHGEAVNEFYSRWPDIEKMKDQRVTVGDKQVPVRDLVLQYAVVYGQMHPGATRKDRIEAVGPMVMMAANIIPGQTPVGSQTRSPMVPTGTNGRPPQPTPFTPAGALAGGASQTTTPQLSSIEAMFAGDPNEA